MILETNSEVGTPKRIQFPEGWIVKPLQEVIHCSFGGGTPSTTNPCFWNGPIPWITTAIINSEDIFLKCFQRGITQKALDNTSTQLAPKGSVLIGTRVGVGKAVVTTFDVAINQDITAFMLKENVDAEFLAYCMKQQAVQSWFEENKRGTTIKGVARNTILNLMIPLPSFPEQRAIARALRAVQGAREARLRELALERERKAALMEHLFTHGTRGEATKMTEIGEMPESWDVVELSNLCIERQGFIQTGPFGSQLHSSDYRKCGIPVVNPTHLGYNTINEEHLPFIDKKDADRLSKHYLIKGDILISRRGDFKRYSYITDHQSGWLCGTGCILIRVNNPNVDNYFLSVLMGHNLIQNYFDLNSVGSIMPNLNTKILLGLPIILPHIEEQRMIASVLRACDSKIAALDHEACLHDELFRAMLEELMSGRLPAGTLVENAALS